jgi:hypothetical protein
VEVYYKRIYANLLELSTGVFINGGRIMDRIKDCKPF